MKIVLELTHRVPELVTILISTIPLVELRGAIPVAINVYGLAPWSALFFGVLGSLIPVFPILWLLKWLEPHLRKIKELDNLIEIVYERTRKKSQLIQDYELIGLVLFIGIPLPGTGVWTGMLAAYLFDLPKGFSFLAALMGTTLAGVIMLFLSDFQNSLSVIGALLFIVVAAFGIKSTMGAKK